MPEAWGGTTEGNTTFPGDERHFCPRLRVPSTGVSGAPGQYLFLMGYIYNGVCL